MDSTLPLLRETFHTILLVGIVLLLLSRIYLLFGCWFLYALRMINECDVTQ